MLKYLFGALLCAHVSALALTCGPVLAGSSSTFTAPTGSFVNLGAGPMTVQSIGTQPIAVCTGASAPANDARCSTFDGGAIPQPFSTPSNVYARSLGRWPALVVSTPIDGGVRAGLYASAGAGQYGLSVASATALIVPNGALFAQICVESAAVRYRDDGTDPTASVGVPVSAGSCFQYSGPLSALKFIAQSGSPTVSISYYK